MLLISSIPYPDRYFELYNKDQFPSHRYWEPETDCTLYTSLCVYSVQYQIPSVGLCCHKNVNIIPTHRVRQVLPHIIRSYKYVITLVTGPDHSENTGMHRYNKPTNQQKISVPAIQLLTFKDSNIQVS